MSYRRMAIRWVGALLVGVVPGACTGDSASTAEGWSGSADTLPSGRIVVSSPDRPHWSTDEAWTLREVFRVGSATAEGPEMFGRVGDVELGSDGALYVLDQQASEVRVFGADGAFLRTLGRFGEGPGELNRPAGMTVGPDGRIWVMNWGNARYTAYDAATGDVSEERRRLASFAMFPWPGAFDRDRLIDVGITPDGQGTVVLRLDTAFVPTDTLPAPELDDEYRIAFRRDGLMVMSTLDPFAPRPFWTVRPQGGIVVGEGADYRIHRTNFTGDTTLTMSLDRSRVPVTGAELDSAFAAFAEMRELAEAAPERDPREIAEKPAHGPLFVDDEDRTWVMGVRSPGEPVAWDVFGSDGRFLGSVPVPLTPGFISPSVRSGRLALPTTVDEVPVVVVYEIVRGGGS